MAIYILITAAVILLCIFFNRLSGKIGMPMLLAFIALGMLFGSDGIFHIHFENYEFAEKICSVALIFIMFYGGFGTKWSEAKPIAVKAILLSSLGVILTAGLTGLFCHFVLGIGLLESLLIGSVIGSTDAASVFSILRSKRLNLKDNTASMLEVESGSNDPCSYMLTVIVLSVMKGDMSGGQVAYMIFAQIAYGLAFGFVIAYAALFVLRKFRFSTEGFDTIFVLAVALIAYAAPAAVGGNGYLSAYIVGIILGNKPFGHKRQLVHFFDGLTGLSQMLIFFLLGLLAFPSQMPGVLLPAIAIAVFLTFVARPAAVFALLSPFRCGVRQQLLVSFAGLRGAASIVFAIMATISPAALNNDLYHIVFCIVLFSIALQGSLIPPVARGLKLIDDNENVMRTFSDYSEEVPVQFVKLSITDEHPWTGLRVSELALPPETLLVMLLRGDERIAPKGDTRIASGDMLVLSARALEHDVAIGLSELALTKKSPHCGKPISGIELEPGELIILIKRGKRVIIPDGGTLLMAGDVLVISS